MTNHAAVFETACPDLLRLKCRFVIRYGYVEDTATFGGRDPVERQRSSPYSNAHRLNARDQQPENCNLAGYVRNRLFNFVHTVVSQAGSPLNSTKIVFYRFKWNLGDKIWRDFARNSFRSLDQNIFLCDD